MATRSRPADPGAQMLVGPHVSVAGGLYHAFANGERVGATCVQIFSRNQRTWRAKPLDEAEAAAFREAWAASSVREVMVHDSYLINLGSPDADLRERSRAAFADEAARCARLGVRLLNFHPGAHLGSDRGQCLERIAEGIAAAMADEASGKVVFTLENTAGQGSAVGETLEDLARLLALVAAPQRTGVCLDTCHLLAAGYDIVPDDGWERFWDDFERLIGLERLRAFHVNDSLRPLGSRVDRHAPLGKGFLGEDFFRRLAADRRFEVVPMFLETPGGDDVWREEVARLRDYRRGAARPPGRSKRR